MKEKRQFPYYLAGIIGSILLFFIGWEYNIPLMGRVSFPLMVYCFRSIPKWYKTLPLVVLLIIIRFFSFTVDGILNYGLKPFSLLLF